MFRKVLIANRGEIAVRVMKTCGEMGIPTVSVYSEADRRALHVLSSDESAFIGEADPGRSYLNIDRILEAARDTGAEAIHPGYGFLAENPEFAARCEKEGVVFIGPPAPVIEKLGNKSEARRIMREGGVPVIPGSSDEVADPAAMKNEADKIGYPVVIKAVAGGGGKGMRIVESSRKFMEAFEAASSEAYASFGDGNVYFEKYLARPRHIEFQVLADSHGNIIHLLERECSIQRRFQKIIEETPSSALDEGLREEMGKAAVRAAEASGYINAGTVEFMLEGDGSYYFLEVNTRLQVEHPITEMVTGIDLVRKQIEIAAGEKLGLSQDEIRGRGHALECRIYAEDPARDFVPDPGLIGFLKEPAGPGIRVDSGIYGGFTVPFQYDPILSKLITYSEKREESIIRMVNALKEYIVLGVKTPVEFLIDVLQSDAFHSGETTTRFIEEEFQEWSPGDREEEIAALAFIADELFGRKKRSPKERTGEETSPWETLGSWKL
jgi:acetyl-CoA carboxylase biotin carboxylase subunit